MKKKKVTLERETLLQLPYKSVTIVSVFGQMKNGTFGNLGEEKKILVTASLQNTVNRPIDTVPDDRTPGDERILGTKKKIFSFRS